MRNFIQEGDVLTFTAPSGGVVSGSAYKIGQLLVVATSTVAEGLPFEGMVEGVFVLPKTDSQAWAEGALIYWDNTNHCATTTATGNLCVGCAAAAVDSTAGLVTGKVYLPGIPQLDHA